jgi:hypothetical protein
MSLRASLLRPSHPPHLTSPMSLLSPLSFPPLSSPPPLTSLHSHFSPEDKHDKQNEAQDDYHRSKLRRPSCLRPVERLERLRLG